jgi:excisionase family DNA binding protein
MDAVVVLSKEEVRALVETAANAVAERLLSALDNPRPRTVTQSEAAEMLGVSRPTIHRMIRAGTVRLNKMGKLRIEDVDALVKQSA